MPRLLLDEMLKKRRMTRYRFALLMRMDRQNIKRFFRPEYDPKLSMLARWARVLKCRIRDLYRE